MILVLLHNPVTYASAVPALCKLRKGRGTHHLVAPAKAKPGPPAEPSEKERLLGGLPGFLPALISSLVPSSSARR
jgi:hypothetical protein